jgi:hypothetical protein
VTIDTDVGQEIRGKDAEAPLKDWDLDIREQWPTSSLGSGLSRTAPQAGPQGPVLDASGDAPKEGSGGGGGQAEHSKSDAPGWRREFARRLRQQGVDANAAEQAVRGQIANSKSDGIYRATRRGAPSICMTAADWRVERWPSSDSVRGQEGRLWQRHEPPWSRLASSLRDPGATGRVCNR